MVQNENGISSVPYAERSAMPVITPGSASGRISSSEIASFCEVNYGVSFPMMAKVDVNGSSAEPLWQWLKGQAPGMLGSEAVKWNFTKVLVGRDGHVLKRYAPKD